MWRRVGAGIAAAGVLGTGGTVAIDRAVINPYDDKGSHYELPIKADIQQGERVEIAKDRAAMTLKGWNDEYAITIEPQIPGVAFGAGKAIDRSFKTQADRPLLSKKMEYRSGDVTAFIEPKEGSENEFDIDFTLDAKPDTNVFEYRIEGAEDIDFFYQPELTPEELAEGYIQSENVIGSYAVYHKTKANHRVGDTNYATGKIMHIYRPKAIDAHGNEIWGRLHYENGVLSVTVDEGWLEQAAYPVVVDPTFGNTSTGANSYHITSANEATVQAFTLPEVGSVTTITAYTGSETAFSGGSNRNAKAIIYDALGTAGAPLNLKGVSQSVLNSGTTKAWRDYTFSSSISLTAGSYYLGITVDSNHVSLRYDNATAGGWRTRDGNYSSPPSTWNDTGGGAGHQGNDIHSIYATYTQPTPDPGELLYVSQNAAASDSVTLPSHITGDLIVCFAGRTDSTTAPSVPGTFTAPTNSINTGTVSSMVVGYRFAESDSETSGTWTNAQTIACAVYRGASTSATHPIVKHTGASGTSQAVNYSGIVSMVDPGVSWGLRAAIHSSDDTNLQNAPSGFTNRADLASGDEIVIHDTDGPVSSVSFAGSVGGSGTSGNWITQTLEILVEAADAPPAAAPADDGVVWFE